MNTFKQIGDHMDHTPGAAVANSAVVLVGTKIGVAIAAIAANTPGTLRVTGVAALPKKAGDTPAQGAAVYWDNTAKYITTTVGSNTYAGYAFAAALSGDATVDVKLNA